ncbi:MAG: shikimate dehydrogenase [Turicibacter sp.]|nr:shikimate dehydrogenase [Turicibacter sp.]
MESRISGATQLIGLIATPIRHSISPQMHNAAFLKLGLDYAYLAFEIEPNQLEATIKGFKAMGVRGFNVSMPYKTAIIDYLDELSPAAKLCQSVNTVVNENGRLIGYMTDGSGLIRSFMDQGYDIYGKKITVIGCGGAGKAILIQAALDGAAELAVFNRSVDRGGEIVNLINEQSDCHATFYELSDEASLQKQLANSDFLINATSVGMADLEGQSIIKDPSILPSHLVVCDIIYNPRKTRLLAQAEARGCQIMNGVGMIIYQGAEAFKLWTGEEMPIDEVKAVLGLY